MKKHDDNFISATLKTDLLLSDYTQTEDPREKDSILEIMSRYIHDMDSKVSMMYSKICDSNEKDKEIYAEILMDLIADCKAEIEVA